MIDTHPPCFADEEAFVKWQEAAEMTGLDRNRYCFDCTKKYQAEMLACGRCIHPETEFLSVVDIDGTGDIERYTAGIEPA